MSRDCLTLTQHLLLFLLVNADSAHSQVHYYITPSLNVPCSQDPCLTLSQFAANFISYLGNETNIFLSFLPGNHSLDRELSLSHADTFSLAKDLGDNGTVFVECDSQSGRFNIRETTFATIQGLHFIGCGGNRVSQVEQFIIKDTIFQGEEGRGRALYTASSNVLIVSSNFTHNTAKIEGGALFAHNSNLHVVESSYSYNRASFGGVMVTSESSVKIINSTFSKNVAMVYGGVMITHADSLSISGSIFTNNRAGGNSGVMEIYGSYASITDCTFSHNIAEECCGVVNAVNNFFSIRSSIFNNNSAAIGGVMITLDSSLNIVSSTFSSNSASVHGGVMWTSQYYHESFFSITDSTFSDNTAKGCCGVIEAVNGFFNVRSSRFTNNSAGIGGVMVIYESLFDIKNSSFNDNTAGWCGVICAFNGSQFSIRSSSFANNSAIDRFGHGGVIHTSDTSYFNVTSSTFTNNSANGGGVMYTLDSSFNITSSTFANNSATDIGGVIDMEFNSSVYIASSTFTNNSAAGGGVIWIAGSSFNIASSNFTNNSALIQGGVISCNILVSSVNIDSSSFYANKANMDGGLMYILGCSTHIADSIFHQNFGSLYIMNSNLTFSGYSRFENCAAPTEFAIFHHEGGAITSFRSTVIFTGVISLLNNQAGHAGGAILVTESRIIMYGKITVANNTVTNGSGGGISLYQSDIEIRGNCIISHNHAMRGGGIHATSSTVAVYQPGTLQFINNRAKNGSGLYLEVNPKLYIFKFYPGHDYSLIFSDNHANCGGAVYVADDTNSGACSPDNECFIQTLTLYYDYSNYVVQVNIFFSGNTANKQGANLFGGLLDRCIPSPYAEVYLNRTIYYSGVSYLGNISNITSLDTISSLPVRVCFCNSQSEPDCSYQPPPIKVKKGEAFTVSLVAVDQVNHSVDANIISSLSSQDGGFREGQQIQSVGRNCTDLTFNVVSPYDLETINLFADGPCGSSKPSIRNLDIQFTDCTCPVGFEPFNSEIRCECICDPELSPYITNCNSTTETLVRMNTNSWITYINNTDPPGYVIHPNCPFDYCQPPYKNISINLNLPNGADTQCAYNRSGILCGACQEYLSLSLGSSHCLPCHSHWPAVLVIIILAAIIAGLLLVTALLALNMTVAVGLIDSFIFYANIVAANSAVFFPSSEPSFPTVFVAWLNLDLGIDVCFFDGLDAYTKTWLQLAFPVYIISLVIVVIIISEYSPQFAKLIGKRDPIATLATLILLSYAKLLSVTITALSYAILVYPDGSQETVWLPDGNVKYFQGKRIAIVIVALLIILIGVPYTILLFLWQWLVGAPQWNVFKWTRNTKLNAFISVHHVPYNNKYRYWTGLLLLVRVVLYSTESVTMSNSNKPQTALLATIIFVVGLLFLKGIIGMRAHKKSIVDVLQTGLYLNVLAFAVFSLYDFKTDAINLRAVAYTSTIITFILLVGVIIYHVSLLVRKDKLLEEVNEYLLAPVQVEPAESEVTHSFIEIPKPRDKSPPPEAKIDEIEVKVLTCTETPVYQ